ncbi:DUF1828 domain-containing protein [Lactobacillus corticis]|uniref:DUF1828 domain-containing protein n=1 Tax=Lactobacillus corticis TaxID=2201249 RepID=A0A916QJ39_9LACO|nr:DUF1828 domain-containing protein [Lactobacillus corticis]GFZ26140.1 hypothetical protein LCB40_00200 [Lactobacillus corticis]
MTKASLLENEYYKWLKKELVFEDANQNYVAISTPFFDSNFDNINLYAKFIDEQHIEISDFGFTRALLEDSGIKINKRSKKGQIFYDTLKNFGISQDDEALVIRTTLENFPKAKNRLFQGVMRINDLVYMTKGNITEAFVEIVSEFLAENNIYNTPNIEIASQDGISAHFDFSIPSNSGKEKLVKTSARPNDLNLAKVFNFDVKATSAVRDATFVYLLDDTRSKTSTKSSIREAALTGIEANTAVVSSFSEIKKANNILVNN